MLNDFFDKYFGSNIVLAEDNSIPGREFCKLELKSQSYVNFF